MAPLRSLDRCGLFFQELALVQADLGGLGGGVDDVGLLDELRHAAVSRFAGGSSPLSDVRRGE